jgi:hypothetical protein
MIITPQHLRACRMCRKGAREFFKKYGLDWHEFAKQGIDETKLLDTRDALATKLVTEAHNGRR